MQCKGANNQCTALLLLSLLLSSQVAAMRMDIRHRDVERMMQQEHSAELDNARKPEDVEKVVQKGKEALAKLKCDQMPDIMTAVLENVTSNVMKTCPTDKPCSLAAVSDKKIEALMEAAMAIAAFSDAADQKMCLGETMARPSVAEATKALKDTWRTVLQGSGSLAVQERMQQASEALTRWQSGVAELHGSALDRKLFFPSSIEDPEHCPSPCEQCTKEHNSQWKVAERFSFKCTVSDNRGPPPAEPELKCPAFQARHRHRGLKTWCAVPDWKTSAYQKASIVAKITCGAEDILSPLRSGKAMPESILSTCLKVEEGKVVTEKAMKEYKDFIASSDDVVSKGAKASFAIFMSLGQAEAIGELRRGARGNNKQNNASALIDVGLDNRCEPRDTPGIFQTLGKVLLAAIPGVLAGAPAGAATGVVWVLFMHTLGRVYLGVKGYGTMAFFTSPLVGGIVGVIVFARAYSAAWQNMHPEQADCPAGELGGVGCVDGMNFNEIKNVKCRDGTPIAVYCQREDSGTMTVPIGCPA